MRVHAFDECLYHGELCHVEQVWDDDGKSWAVLRPADQSDAGTEGGVYFADQADVCLATGTEST